VRKSRHENSPRKLEMMGISQHSIREEVRVIKS
jgi:hypothetical protein